MPPKEDMDNMEISKAVLWVRVISKAEGRFGRSNNITATTTKATRFSTPVTLYIFQVNQGPEENSDEEEEEADVGDHQSKRPQLLKSQRIVKTGWKKINLTQDVRKWLQGSSASDIHHHHHHQGRRRNLTLLIDCNGCNNQIQLDLKPRAKGGATLKADDAAAAAADPKSPAAGRTLKPFLVIDTENKRQRRRSRRHAYNCEAGIKQCCKQSLSIDFAEIGWDDWIIYPSGYTANYCMGECAEQQQDVRAYFHSHVLEEYRIRNPFASIAPCCAPTKLSSISLIYLDKEKNIIKSDLPKMVVQECGCT